LSPETHFSCKPAEKRESIPASPIQSLNVHSLLPHAIQTMTAPLKRLALFGSSGQTGLVVAHEALARNYALNLLVRTPSKLPASIATHPNVAVIQGDVTNSEDVLRTIINGATDEEQAAGIKRPAAAVLSCLGTQILRGPPAQVHSIGTRNIIAVLNSPGSSTKRLITMSAVGVGESAKDTPFWAMPASYLANTYILKEVQDDKAIMEKEVMESGIGWFHRVSDCLNSK